MATNDGLGKQLWGMLEQTGASDEAIALRLGASQSTVYRWRKVGIVAKSQSWESKIWATIEELSASAQARDAQHLRTDLQRTIVSAATMLRRLSVLTPDQVLSAVIAELSKAKRNIRLTVAPAYRGHATYGLDSPLHYLVGVDVFSGPPPATTLLSQSEVVNIVVDTLRSEWGVLGLHLRHGLAPEWDVESQPTVVLQIPIAERPRPVPAIGPVAIAGLGKRLLVLAPVYGYGELLAALLAEALGFGLVDLRYQEAPPTAVDVGSPKPGKAFHRAAREARHLRAQNLLRSESSNLAWCVAGEQLLKDLRSDITPRLPDTTVVAVAYGHKWAHRGHGVHKTPVRDQTHNGVLALDVAEQAASRSIAIEVNYDDSDVVLTESEEQADVDLIANQTVLTAIAILDKLAVSSSLWRDGWLKNLDNAGELPRLREQVDLRRSTVLVRRPN